jgi:hypothetical protein
MSFFKPFVYILIYTAIGACKSPPSKEAVIDNAIIPKTQLKNIAYTNPSFKVIHVFVALCDNKYQGIVPVPPKIGNGQDPETNLYWGCDNGVRTYFKKSKQWHLVKSVRSKKMIMERLIFKHQTFTWLPMHGMAGPSKKLPKISHTAVPGN